MKNVISSWLSLSLFTASLTSHRELYLGTERFGMNHWGKNKGLVDAAIKAN